MGIDTPSPHTHPLPPRGRLLRVGLTGGIASGKSMVAQLFVKHAGAALVDADAVSRALTAPGGAALHPIEQAFGSGVLHPATGLDRAAMRELIFHDPSAKRRLEAILHPLIQDACWSLAEQYEAQTPPPQFVLFEVPLLFESAAHWRRRLDKIVVVDCTEQTQLTRLFSRSGLEPALAQRIIASQATRRERRSIADILIYNENTDANTLASMVKRLGIVL